VPFSDATEPIKGRASTAATMPDTDLLNSIYGVASLAGVPAPLTSVALMGKFNLALE